MNDGSQTFSYENIWQKSINWSEAFILQRGGESRKSDEAAVETKAVSQEETEAEPTGQQDI